MQMSSDVGFDLGEVETEEGGRGGWEVDNIEPRLFRRCMAPPPCVMNFIVVSPMVPSATISATSIASCMGDCVGGVRYSVAVGNGGLRTKVSAKFASNSRTRFFSSSLCDLQAFTS